jgi:phosphotransferase system enzyme I (PtsI)
MDLKRGIAVSPGVAIGPALVLDSEGYRIPQRHVDGQRLDGEVQRLHASLQAAVAEARKTQASVTGRLGAQYGAIFAAHAQLLEDPNLAREIEGFLREHLVSAEYATSQVMRRYAKLIEDLGDQTLASRVADVFDLEKRILRCLLGQRCEELRHLTEPVILLAHDLTPSEAAALDRAHVLGFATEAGGRTSHTAIVAGMLEMPALVGVGRFITDVSGGDLVIVDGNEGQLILRPDPQTLARYEQARKSHGIGQRQLEAQRELPAVTRDGERITLLGNIEFPEESKHCLERGAEGIGLYRTEFLYLDRDSHPSEEEHFEAYRGVLHAVGPERAVVIRTLDLGADKFPMREEAGHERNPFLGLRSVRLCLRNLTLFKTQLRAILRASAFGDVRLLFPMISTLLEIRQCKMLLAEVKEDLEDEGVAYNPRLPIGTMIEVPSAALLAEQLAREVDFFSIGTNDLVQYTLAADRNNEAVASLYNPAEPAVLRLIDQVVQAAQKARIGANVCGEMCGEPEYTMLLLGLGLRHLSATPHKLPQVKQLIRAVSVPECVAVAQEALRLEAAREVNNYLREQTRRVLPETEN